MSCWVIDIALCLVFTGLMIATSAMYSSLLAELKLRLPAALQIAPGDRTKVLWVLRRHAEIFPESHRRQLVWGLGIFAIITFLAFCAVTLACFGSATTR